MSKAWTFRRCRHMSIMTFHITSNSTFYLTHWGRDKMATIFQTTFSNAFSWMKMFKFRLKFQWSMFPRVQLTIFQHWFRWWLGAGQETSHYLNQWWLVYWRIYASLGLNELTFFLTKQQLKHQTPLTGDFAVKSANISGSVSMSCHHHNVN